MVNSVRLGLNGSWLRAQSALGAQGFELRAAGSQRLLSVFPSDHPPSHFLRLSSCVCLPLDKIHMQSSFFTLNPFACFQGKRRPGHHLPLSRSLPPSAFFLSLLLPLPLPLPFWLKGPAWPRALRCTRPSAPFSRCVCRFTLSLSSVCSCDPSRAPL